MEKHRRNRLPSIGLYLLTLTLATGCMPSWGQIVRSMQSTVTAHPQLQEKLASIKTVAIMPPNVTIYQRSLGATQVMEEETVTARRTLTSAVERELERHAGVVFTPSPPLEPDVERSAKLTKADALLFTTGVDHVSTGGRTAALIGGALAFCLMTVPIGGGGCYLMNTNLIAPPGTTILSVRLIDGTTGTLLWHNAAGFQGGAYSLTNANSAADLVERVFWGFPLGTTPPTRNEYGGKDPSRIGGMN